MQLSTLLLLPLIAVASASPKRTGTSDPTFCERGLKLCDIAQSWEDCSELYIASMKAYVFEKLTSKADKWAAVSSPAVFSGFRIRLSTARILLPPSV
jgi:hypothetical protein